MTIKAGSQMIERVYGVTVRSMNDEKRSVDVIASTSAVDSYDEIVEQDWDLDRYKGNPVVLWNHNRGSFFASDPSAALPIGCATECRVEDGKLVATLSFVNADANPIAEKVWQGFKQGSLRAVSVGFMPGNVRQEKRDGVEMFVLSKCELHEISVVPVPANPEAVSLARAAAHEQLRTLAARGSSPNVSKENKTMSILITLAAVLGLTSTASENDVTDAVRSNKSKADKVPFLEANVRELESRVKTVETEATAQKAQNATLVTERDAANKRAEVADEKSLAVELDALVGDKLEPHEVRSADGTPGPMAELAKSNRPLFNKMVGQRTSKKGDLGRKSVLETHKTEIGKSATSDDDLADIESKIDKAAD